MACFGISLGDLLPWLKHFIAIPSPERPYTSSPRSISMPEERSSPASHRNSVNSRTGYVSGTLDLPSPARLHTVSKSTMDDEYHMWKPFACNRTRPLPMPRSRQRPDAFYSPALEIDQYLGYEGVRYRPDSPYYLWLLVKYNDSTIGYVGVPSLSFNADVSLQRELKNFVPQYDWNFLENRGFGFLNPIL